VHDDRSVMVTAMRLSPDQTESAAAALARAFFPDPLWVHILPDAEDRRRSLPAFFAATVAFGLLHGRVDSTPAVDGAAVWIPPATAGEEAAGPDAAEYGAVDDQFDAAAAARFDGMVRHYQALRERDMPVAHWYLACLGVDPSRQRLGIGRALLQPVLETADATGLPCYLETENEVNLPFYRGLGFRIVSLGTIPAGGPSYWTMRRPPSGG
jgi:ribosomal protein S18 acetylase RimI-like enzyme